MFRTVIIAVTFLGGICAADAQTSSSPAQSSPDQSAKTSVPTSKRGPAFPKGVASDHRNSANWIAAPKTPDPSTDPAWLRQAQRRYEFLQRDR